MRLGRFGRQLYRRMGQKVCWMKFHAVRDSMQQRKRQLDRTNMYPPNAAFSAKSMLCVLVLLSLGTLMVGSSAGQQIGSDMTEPHANSESRADGLAGGSYADRQRATLEMWRRRDRSRQVVQDAARHQDPEIAQRAEWILKQWRNGLLPGVGPGPGNLLLDRGNESALATVLEMGAFDAVSVAVEESAGTIEFDQIKQRVANLLTDRYPIYIDKAIQQGTLKQLMRLLDAVAVNRNLATARRDLALFLNLNDIDSLPSSASVWGPSDQDVCRSLFAMLDGRSAQSLELAKRSNDTTLLRVSQMLTGDWEAIAADAVEQANSEVTSLLRVEALAWALAAYKRIDDQEGAAAVAKQLNEFSHRDLGMDQNQREQLDQLRWRALALNDELDSAIDVLQSIDPSLASKIACLASRHSRAEQLCGFDLDRVHTHLDQWIDDAFSDQAATPLGTLSPKMNQLYALGRLLVSVGDPENALRIYRRLTAREIIVSQYGESLRERTIDELDRIDQMDWVIELAVAQGEKTSTTRINQYLAWALNTDIKAFLSVLDRVRLVKPKMDFRQRFQITCQLFRGKPHTDFQADKDFDDLYDALVSYRAMPRLTSSRTARSLALDLKIVDLFLRQGKVELARRGLEALSLRGDANATIMLAEREMKHGEQEASLNHWDSVAQSASTFSPDSTVVTSDRGTLYAKSLIGKWILAKRAGHDDVANDMHQRIRLMLTSPSLTFRKEVAAYLREQQQFEFAAEILKDLVVLTAFGGPESPDFFRVSVAFVSVIDELAESNPTALDRMGIGAEESLRWSDLAMFGLLKSTGYYDRVFVSMPLSVRKAYLRYATETKDADLAARSIKQIESYDPLNIDFGERMLPKLREAGLTTLANQAFDRLMQRGMKHLHRFGTNATALNNIAWTAAMNQRQLKNALELSQRSVLLEPDSVVYRDTLAELLHLLGRTKEALAIESACLLDDAEEWHLHEQIEKYRKVLAR